MLIKTVLFLILAVATYADDTVAYSLFKRFVNDICDGNNATADKVEQVKILLDEFVACTPKMPQIDQLMKELDEAQRQGTVDRVAKKFCAVAPQTIPCTAKIINIMGLCASLTQKDILHMTNVDKRMHDYMCYEEENKTRLTKLVEDGATQCFATKSQYFFECMRTGEVYSLRKNPMKNNDQILRCAVENLKACSSSLGLQGEKFYEYVSNEHHNIDNITSTLVTTPRPLTTPRDLTTPIINKLFNININATFSISLSKV